jgi:hypothetical protein
MWYGDRNHRHGELEAALQQSVPLPFPTCRASVTLEAELINTPAHRYLRNTALAALHRLGGVREHPFTLPAWADCPWEQVPPRSVWQKLKSLYIMEF